jgi:hypothetical protein
MPKKKLKKPPVVGLRTKCDYCNKKKSIFYAECDPEWELKGHPDHIFRMVCRDCHPDVDGRYACAEHVYDAMRFQMDQKGMTQYEVESAIHLVWRALNVGLDIKSFVKLARQLKVDHPWLKGKKAK